MQSNITNTIQQNANNNIDMTDNKRHNNVTRHMQRYLNHYLVMQHLEYKDTNSSLLSLLCHSCGLSQYVTRVRIVYSKKVTPRMCSVQFSVPILSSAESENDRLAGTARRIDLQEKEFFKQAEPLSPEDVDSNDNTTITTSSIDHTNTTNISNTTNSFVQQYPTFEEYLKKTDQDYFSDDDDAGDYGYAYHSGRITTNGDDDDDDDGDFGVGHPVVCRLPPSSKNNKNKISSKVESSSSLGKENDEDDHSIVDNSYLLLEQLREMIQSKYTNEELQVRLMTLDDIPHFMKRKGKSSRGRGANGGLGYSIRDIHPLLNQTIQGGSLLDIVHIVDFEMAVVSNGDYFPLEMAVLKYSLSSKSIVDTFHRFINLENQVPLYLRKTEDYTRRFIHGIPSDMGVTDYVQLWKDFLQFVSVTSEQEAQQCVLLANNPIAENGCFRWFQDKVDQLEHTPFYFNHISLYDVTLDLPKFLSLHQADLPVETLSKVNKLLGQYLNYKDKCSYHQCTSPHFHCAQEDCYTIAHMFSSCFGGKEGWLFGSESLLDENVNLTTREQRLLAYKLQASSAEEDEPSSPSMPDHVYDEWDIVEDTKMFFEE